MIDYSFEQLINLIDETLSNSSYAQIARESGVSKSTIWRLHKRQINDIGLKTASAIFLGIKKIKKNI